MRVTCNANTGQALTKKYLIGNTVESIFHVSIGKEYRVFAIAVYRGATLLLLSDEDNLPNWYPMDLFSISDSRLPHDWYGAAYPSNDDGLQFLLGYKQIAFDEEHYDALLEREPHALRTFFQEVARRIEENPGPPTSPREPTPRPVM
jgi:hypothetical protein